MSKNYFELDAQGKKALADKHNSKKADNFGGSATTTEETTTTTEAPQEEEAAEYPLNED
jgi:hypothetical protein